MKVFKNAIECKISDMVYHRLSMLEFSNTLKEKMNLQNRHVHDMIMNDVSFETKNYYIIARAICMNPGWRDLILAIPKSMGTKKVGWSNIPCERKVPGWFFYPGGTTTIIYPLFGEDENVLKEVADLECT